MTAVTRQDIQSGALCVGEPPEKRSEQFWMMKDICDKDEATDDWHHANVEDSNEQPDRFRV